MYPNNYKFLNLLNNNNNNKILSFLKEMHKNICYLETTPEVLKVWLGDT